MDAGFILMLLLHHGDLELDSVGVSTNHVAISVAWTWLGWAIREIKIPVQELWLKM